MRDETLRGRFAVMNNAYAAYSFEYFLDSIQRLGLDKIDLWGGVEHFNPYAASEASTKALRRELGERGMQVVAYTPELLAYPYNFAHPDERTRRDSVDYALDNLDIAAWMEIPLMLLSPGWGLLDIPYEQSAEWSADCLGQLAEEAAARGVRLVLEHLTPQSSNLLTNVSQLKGMLARVNHPALGAVLDLGQMSVFDETVADYTTGVGERLWHLHLMDGGPGGHLALGDGVLPVEAYWAQLERWGYRGYYTLEINDGRYAADPHAALAQTTEALRAWQEGEI